MKSSSSKSHRTTAFAALLMGTAAGASAHDSMPAPADQRVEEIVVTGTLFETPLDQVGRSVSVITEDQIELRQQRFVYEALTAVPGVQVTQSGSPGGITSVSIRGLESDQTLVVQDGIVLNNPGSFGNTFNFANFDTSDVERIEVIRGAQSTLYGTDAIGGVINIVTKSGADGFGGNAFFEGGSFATFRGGASLRGGTERVAGRASLSGTRTDGFSSADEANGNTEDDGFDNITASGKGTLAITGDLSLQALVRYQNSQNDFDAFTTQPVDGDNVADTEELTVGGFATYTMFDDRLSHRLSLTYVSVDQKNREDGALTFDNKGTRLSAEYRGEVKPIAAVGLIFGAEYEEQEARTAVGFGDDQTIETSSGYGLVRVTPYDGVSVSAGVRHDASDTFGSETTASAAATARIPQTGVTLRGSYTEGFRAPSAGELGFNAELFAETSTSWDVGLERAFLQGRLSLSATYFDQEVDNLIAFDLTQFTFLNVQAFETSGVEIGADIALSDRLRLTAAYTYLDAFNATTTVAATNQPDHRFNAEVSYRPTERLALSAGIAFNGEEPASGGRTLDSFTRVTVRGEYALTDWLDAFVRVDNVTDANYQDNLGFGTAPISAFAGLRTRF